MIKYLKIILDIIKEEKEAKKYRATLAKMPLHLEALRALVKESEKSGVKIEVHQPDGHTITIYPADDNKNGYVPFVDKFRQGR